MNAVYLLIQSPGIERDDLQTHHIALRLPHANALPYPVFVTAWEFHGISHGC